jgi:hypothetical protein
VPHADDGPARARSHPFGGALAGPG